MGTIGEEHDHGEVVPEEELANASEDKKHAAEPNRGACGCDSLTARAMPTHWYDCQLQAREVENWYSSEGEDILKAHASGNTDTENPSTPTGVGLPKVLRRSPFTSVLGEMKSLS
jgi:hypothetical protein